MFVLLLIFRYVQWDKRLVSFLHFISDKSKIPLNLLCQLVLRVMGIYTSHCKACDENKVCNSFLDGKGLSETWKG